MSATSQGAARHIKTSYILVVLLCIAIIASDASVAVALFAEGRLIAQYGFGHVPEAKIDPLISIGDFSPSVDIGASFLRLACFGYFIFWCVKSIDLLGIEHRSSRLFSAISIVIPLVGYYVPWASLGETRQTFDTMVEQQMRPRKTTRKFDLDTLLLGLVWIGGSFADRIIAATTGRSDPINAENWQAYLSNTSFWMVVATGIEVLILLTFLRYGRGMLRRYRQVLAVAATDVFVGPEPEVARDYLPARS